MGSLLDSYMGQQQQVAFPQPIGPFGRMSQSLMAGAQLRRNEAQHAAMAQQYAQAAAGRFASIGTPRAQQFAGMLRQNPRLAVAMADQYGGVAKLEEAFLTEAREAAARQEASRALASSPDPRLQGLAPTAMQDAGLATSLAGATDPELREVFDPSSPSLSRLAPEYEAEGQYGPMRGLRARISPDGTIEFGSGAGLMDPMALTKPSVNAAQKSVMGANETIATLEAMERALDPTAFNPFTKWTDSGKRWLRNVGLMDLSEPEVREMWNRKDFRMKVLQNANATIRALTGAVMSINETERILGSLPTIEDFTPEEFALAVREAITTAQTARNRNLYLLKTGRIDANYRFPTAPEQGDGPMGLNEYEMLEMRRGDEIEAQLREQYPDLGEEELGNLVDAQINEELESGESANW